MTMQEDHYSPNYEIELGEAVYDDLAESMEPISFGNWKRSTEALIGRTLEPIEATAMWDLISIGSLMRGGTND